MANIKNVASIAGVSVATVSRTLKKPELVKKETRQLVMNAVNQLGYTPNVFGSSLRTRRSETVVVLVPDISNPFFAEIILGIEQVAHENGYSILLGDTQNNSKREDAYANYLNTKQSDGLIFLGHRMPGSVSHYVRKSNLPAKPIVNACEYSPNLGVPGVYIDNQAAAFEAVSYLLKLRHRRIGFITGPMEGPLSKNRLKGTRKALATKKIELTDDMVYHGDFSIDAGIKAAKVFLDRKKRPTALFCFNDEMAMGVMEYCRSHDIGIPDELSLVGFDDIRFAQYTNPPLTTVYQPTKEIGRTAMQLLLELLSEKKITKKNRVLPTKLIIRDSTAIL